jgi:hypothetical protein
LASAAQIASALAVGESGIKIVPISTGKATAVHMITAVIELVQMNISTE